MASRLLALVVASLLPLSALAQSSDTFQCTMDGLTRRVEVVREGASGVPCEVRYHKDTEAPGETQVLWSASSEIGYCGAQAEGFIERLRGLGWTCGAGVTAAAPAPATPAAPASATPAARPAPAAEPADDTEALSAPE